MVTDLQPQWHPLDAFAMQVDNLKMNHHWAAQFVTSNTW